MVHFVGPALPSSEGVGVVLSQRGRMPAAGNGLVPALWQAVVLWYATTRRATLRPAAREEPKGGECYLSSSLWLSVKCATPARVCQHSSEKAPRRRCGVLRPGLSAPCFASHPPTESPTRPTAFPPPNFSGALVCLALVPMAMPCQSFPPLRPVFPRFPTDLYPEVHPKSGRHCPAWLRAGPSQLSAWHCVAVPGLRHTAPSAPKTT